MRQSSPFQRPSIDLLYSLEHIVNPSRLTKLWPSLGNLTRKTPVILITYMIELKDNKLLISFPDVHKDAHATVEFNRTLRIPNDGQDYLLPPRTDNFELRSAEDNASTATSWKAKSGAKIPMYQSEALQIAFKGDYPIAIKVGITGINAIDGSSWVEGFQPTKSIRAYPQRTVLINQNYIIISKQHHLSYFCDDNGLPAQLVAAPIGLDETTNEQIDGSITGRKLLIEAFPLGSNKWEEILEKRCAHKEKIEKYGEFTSMYKSNEEYELDIERLFTNPNPEHYVERGRGKMRQIQWLDPYESSNWNVGSSSSYWIKICNTLEWEQMTTEKPTHAPFSAKDYANVGLPWFKHYSEKPTFVRS